MTFGELLIELRTARGLSQEQLAEQAAVSVRAISDLERGVTRRPHRDTVRALADGLTLSGDDRDALTQAARQAPPASKRGRAAPRVGLPAPVSSIVGREGDVAAVVRLVRGAAVRLVTVTGPGGVGKTRLAVEVGWRAAAAFDRVDAVDLSALRTAEDVPAALATALGCPNGDRDPIAAVAAAIGDTATLLVLDSFEHVAEAAATLAALLARCPKMTVLVTSRAPLRLRGEHLWPLAPLPVPTADADAGAASGDGTNPAVALLVERAAAVRPGFALTAANAAATAALCRHTEGLPLAIELAAAHLRTLEPDDLVAQLTARHTVLRADTVDGPDRHQTLRDTVAWSTDRLDPDDRLRLGALAVFRGGAAPAAVRTVLTQAGLGAGSLDASLSLLAAVSLVTVSGSAGRSLIRMLDAIREVAAESLVASGHDAAIRRAHATVFLGMARDGLTDGVDADLDNVRAALAWTVANEPATLDTSLVTALTGYFTSRSRFGEARRTLAAIADSPVAPAVRARALHGAGIAANELGDHRAAVGLAEESAALCDGLADRSGRAAALTLAGNAHKALGHHALALAAHQDCLELARAEGDLRRASIALNNLGTLHNDRGDQETAHRCYVESLQAKRDLGDERGIAVGLVNLGGLANDLGRSAEAREHLRQAVDRWRTIGEQHSLAYALAMLAEAELGAGDGEAAAGSAAEALAIGRRVEYPSAIGLALGRLGDIALASGDGERAARCYRDALEHVSDPPEVARTLEHLAAALAPTAPDEARRALADAARTRASHQCPAPDSARELIERTAAGLAA